MTIGFVTYSNFYVVILVLIIFSSPFVIPNLPDRQAGEVRNPLRVLTLPFTCIELQTGAFLPILESTINSKTRPEQVCAEIPCPSGRRARASE